MGQAEKEVKLTRTESTDSATWGQVDEISDARLGIP